MTFREYNYFNNAISDELIIIERTSCDKKEICLRTWRWLIHGSNEGTYNGL